MCKREEHCVVLRRRVKQNDIPCRIIECGKQLCAPTGYSEGWAVFSELFISGISEKYGVGGCTLREYESVLANILIPAYVSIKVNCEGWTTEDIGDYLKSFGLDQQEYIDVIYE